MGNDSLNKEELFITLTIEGTPYEEVWVEVTDPMKTIREQVDSIVKVFQLSNMDHCGNPVTYLLGRLEDDSDCPSILEFEDEYGKEQTLIDYNVQSGDYLQLISKAIAAYACPIPEEMKNKWIEYFNNCSGNAH